VIGISAIELTAGAFETNALVQRLSAIDPLMPRDINDGNACPCGKIAKAAVFSGSDQLLSGVGMPVTQEEVLSALKQCYDPEIPVNIVDLGLIYGVRFEPAPDEKQDVTVDMTLTAQGCPAHVQISDQVRSRLEQLPGIRDAHVNVVWSPAWTPERLSVDARKQLGIE
jgi:metal-sulfur cluster biosynthetic enzyme